MLETHPGGIPADLTVGDAVRQGTARLKRKRIRSPRLDAELMLGSILGRSRAYLLAHPELHLDSAQAARWTSWLRKRAGHYPIQYLLGNQEFYGRGFAVGPGVLIPRPETELLVDVCLERLDAMARPSPKVLDVGTGSGAIAVTLAAERPRLRVTATDISRRSLSAARRNAARHGCESRIEFLEGWGLAPLEGRAASWDLVVSNPPYVPAGDGSRVDRSVAAYEPGAAVFAGPDGLEMYELLLKGCPSVMTPSSPLVLEIAAGSRGRVCRLARRWGWRGVETRRDLAGLERCLVLVRSHPGETYDE